MFKKNLATGVLATFVFGMMPVAVEAQEFQPGQLIYFNYYGEKAEAKIILQDSNGLKIEAKNPLTKKYDGSNIRYIAPKDATLAQPGGAGGGSASGGGAGQASLVPSQRTPAAGIPAPRLELLLHSPRNRKRSLHSLRLVKAVHRAWVGITCTDFLRQRLA